MEKPLEALARSSETLELGIFRLLSTLSPKLRIGPSPLVKRRNPVGVVRPIALVCTSLRFLGELRVVDPPSFEPLARLPATFWIADPLSPIACSLPLRMLEAKRCPLANARTSGGGG